MGDMKEIVFEEKIEPVDKTDAFKIIEDWDPKKKDIVIKMPNGEELVVKNKMQANVLVQNGGVITSFKSKVILENASDVQVSEYEKNTIERRNLLNKQSQVAMDSIANNFKKAMDDKYVTISKEEETRIRALAKDIRKEAKASSINCPEVAVVDAKVTGKKINSDMIVTLCIAGIIGCSLITHATKPSFNNLVKNLFYEKEFDLANNQYAVEYVVENPKKEEAPLEKQNINDIYNIGDKFVPNYDAKIYTDYEFASNPNTEEAMKNADTPYHDIDTPRIIDGIAFSMPDKTIKYAHNREEEIALEQAGGITISLGGTIPPRRKIKTGYIMPDGSIKYAHNTIEEIDLEAQGGLIDSIEYLAEEGYYNVDDVSPYIGQDIDRGRS